MWLCPGVALSEGQSSLCGLLCHVLAMASAMMTTGSCCYAELFPA